jgi:hypothetical protein
MESIESSGVIGRQEQPFDLNLESSAVDRCQTHPLTFRDAHSDAWGGMVQTITSDGDGKRLGEGVEGVLGPLPLESTFSFGAHAPVCSFVVCPALKNQSA